MELVSCDMRGQWLGVELVSHNCVSRQWHLVKLKF